MLDRSCIEAIDPLLEILDGKWTLPLLLELFVGTKRFGELRRKLHPISPKTLTDRLRCAGGEGDYNAYAVPRCAPARRI
ncbi:winged helix-turn-helix transcriptional regulator [Paenibacillus sp. V4I7]|uniref:winged helix-turn-helix transcriptional regulator n=1 Tax=Paenibacillus sp. V4I7 TaxID=3042307 RepID=UPI00277F6C0E|nr:DNA-binding HxlR family transcriptional regulator [Paenibacillus sp. V4I7]